MIKLSRYKIEKYINCKRCFILYHSHSISPTMIPFTLNNAVDDLCKNEFDYYRQRQEPHPLFKEYNIDALIGLSWSPAWAINHDGGDDQAIAEYKFWVNGSFAAMAGYPHVTIPFDYVDKLPIGMSFIGSKWDDKKLIELAYAAEQLIQFKPTPNI